MTNQPQPGTKIYEALEALADMVVEHCYDDRGLLDSLAISANADAMSLLAEHGWFVIKESEGRRIIGRMNYGG